MCAGIATIVAADHQEREQAGNQNCGTRVHGISINLFWEEENKTLTRPNHRIMAGQNHMCDLSAYLNSDAAERTAVAAASELDGLCIVNRSWRRVGFIARCPVPAHFLHVRIRFHRVVNGLHQGGEFFILFLPKEAGKKA